MKKTKYKVITGMNFSICNDEFYLKAGDVVELPEHELVDSLVQKKHIVEVVDTELPETGKKNKNINNEKS